MPFSSKQQMKLFYAAAAKKGGIKGLSQKAAKKFIKDSDHQSMEGLPETVEKKKFSKLKKMMRGK